MRGIKNCILFSTADWDAPYWTNKQHTAKYLAGRDFRVLYVESVGLRAPKLTSGIDLARIWRRLIRGLSGVRQVELNIWVISPLVIPFKHQWKIIGFINRWILRRSITNFCKRECLENQDTMIWTYHPYVLDYLECKDYGSLAYHCVDDLSAIPGINALSFIAKERDLLKGANVVFTTSKTLFDKCYAVNQNTYNFSNVVDWEHFSQAFAPAPDPVDLKNIPHPRLGYIGVLSDLKVDFELLFSIAQEMPEWHIVLIGEEREGQSSPIIEKLKKMDNVHFLGYKKYEELPNYLRGFDVGLLPTLINSYTASMFPMKFFEYVSAGLPTAVTALDFLNQLPIEVMGCKDTDQFRLAISKGIISGKFPKNYAYSVVGENTWDKRLDKMLTYIR